MCWSARPVDDVLVNDCPTLRRGRVKDAYSSSYRWAVTWNTCKCILIIWTTQTKPILAYFTRFLIPLQWGQNTKIAITPDRSVRPLGRSVDVIWQVCIYEVVTLSLCCRIWVSWLRQCRHISSPFRISCKVCLVLRFMVVLGVWHVVFYRINLYPWH